MASVNLPPEMAELRPKLDAIVAGIEQRAPYGAVLLSTQQGLQISVNNREQSVTQRTPASGTVITAYDGQTVYEEAVGGFDRAAVERGGRDLCAPGRCDCRSRGSTPGRFQHEQRQ